jgi:hypothetical protein
MATIIGYIKYIWYFEKISKKRTLEIALFTNDKQYTQTILCNEDEYFTQV